MIAAARWVVLSAVAVLLLCLLVWARGESHHRGDEVGALPAGASDLPSAVR